MGAAAVVVTGSLHKIKLTSGTGKTVTVTEFCVPVQRLAVGVTIYVTESIAVPVLLITWPIDDPLPGPKPLTLPELPLAVQA
jgi:hypothetical protein